MPSELDLLHTTTLTATVVGFKFPEFLLQGRLFPAAEISGDTAEWDILKPGQSVGEFVASGAPAKVVELEVVAHRMAKCLKRFDSKLLSGDFLNNLRDTGTRQKNARAMLTREQESLSRRNAYAREYCVAKALSGSLAIAQDDVKVTIDYGIAAEHKPTASVSWATSTTEIPEDVVAWKRLIEEDSGYAPGYAFANDSVLRYLLKNQNVKDLLGESALREQIAQSGAINAFMGLEWIFYNAGYRDAEGTFVPFIPDDTVILTPAVPGWCAMQVGSTMIPSGGGSGKELVEVSGRYSFVDLETNPPGVKLFCGDCFLPVITIPGAVVYADVTP
jgi:hypothetical protein